LQQFAEHLSADDRIRILKLDHQTLNVRSNCSRATFVSEVLFFRPRN
jgi:hypothetical protein